MPWHLWGRKDGEESRRQDCCSRDGPRCTSVAHCRQGEIASLHDAEGAGRLLVRRELYGRCEETNWVHERAGDHRWNDDRGEKRIPPGATQAQARGPCRGSRPGPISWNSRASAAPIVRGYAAHRHDARRKDGDYDFLQEQAGPHLQLAPHSQPAAWLFALALWQPQLQVAPAQGEQWHGFELVNILNLLVVLIDLLSTTEVSH